LHTLPPPPRISAYGSDHIIVYHSIVQQCSERTRSNVRERATNEFNNYNIII